MKKIAVAIFGPTGVGKTALSLELAEKTGEIISVDSRQVYRFMDIGTAKPSLNDRSRVNHHLIDIITPDIVYAAGEFKRNAEQLIDEIAKKNKIPFLVGGTGLYFNSLINGMAEIPKIKPELRKNLFEKWEKIGQKRMHSILLRIDPVFGSKIHNNDKQRTLRALEVYFETGKRLSEYINTGNTRKDFAFIKIGINIERDDLYSRINKRVDLMLEEGLVDETKKLIEMGYTGNYPGMKGIGYKEMFQYLTDEINFDQAVDEVKQKSRNYAKRQMTWFKIVPETRWFKPDEMKSISSYIEESMERILKVH
jgi:tRNA dimethylallyltransferase